MRGTSWPVWQRAVLAAVVLGFVAVVVVASTGGARQQRLADGWEADLAAWEADVATLPEVPALADVVDGTGREAVEDGPEALDRVNDVCARVNGFAEAVAERSGPPPAPEGLDAEATEAAAAVERYERDRTAWGDLEAATSDPWTTVRTFCGSYPSVMAASAAEAQAQARMTELLPGCAASGCAVARDADAGAVAEAGEALQSGTTGRADALAASCFLAELAPWCAAEATSARELVAAQQTLLDAVAAGDADAAAEAVGTADRLREAPLPDDVVDLGLGEDRAAIAASVVAAVGDADDALDGARTGLLEVVETG